MDRNRLRKGFLGQTQALLDSYDASVQEYGLSINDPYEVARSQSNSFAKSLRNTEGTNLYTGDKLAREAYLDKAGKDYGFTDWVQDAWSLFMQSMNESLANDFEGQKQRAQEYLDLVPGARQHVMNLQIYDDILLYKKHKNLGLDTSDDLKKLQKELPKIDFSSRDLDKQLQLKANQLGTELLLGKSKKDYETLVKMTGQRSFGVISDLLSEIGIKTHDNSETFENDSLTGPMQDWFGDRVDDASVMLRGLNTMSNGKKLQMLDKYSKHLQNVQAYSERARLKNLQEKEEYEKEHPISEYFKTRAQIGKQKLLEGGSMWDWDNIAYGNIEQLGFSSSAWDKQALALGASIAGAVLTGGSSLGAQLAGAGLLGVGASAQYNAGQSENNAEVYEHMKTKVSKSLTKDQSRFKRIAEDYLKKNPNAKLENLTDDILSGKYKPENSKDIHDIANGIRSSIEDARIGVNAMYKRDQYAVATDAMIDASLFGIRLPKILGSGLIKAASKSAKLTPVKEGGKWVVEHTNKLASNLPTSAIEKGWNVGLRSGTGLIGGAAGSTIGAISPYALRLGKWALNENKYGRKMVNAVKSAVKRTHLDDEASDYMLRKRLAKYVGKPATFIGKIAASGYSESIEEGKQAWNAQDYLNNENPDRIVDVFDGVLRDAQYGYHLMDAAIGLPFGQRWGMAKKEEFYADMAGGYLGGAMHNSLVFGGLAALSSLIGPDKISIADVISHNAELDRASAITRYTKGIELLRSAYKNPKATLRQIDDFEQFNKQRRELGLDALTDEEMTEERDYVKHLLSVAKHPVIQQLADDAGYIRGSEDWLKYISARAMFRNMIYEDDKRISEIDKQLDLIILKAYGQHLSGSEVDRIKLKSELEEKAKSGDQDAINQLVDIQSEDIEDQLFGQEKDALDGILRKSSKKENIVKRVQHEKELLQKAENGDKKAKASLNKMIDTDTERALASSVANTEEQEELISEEDKRKQALRVIAELNALQDLLNNVDTIEQFAGTIASHEKKYVRQAIESRINKLKKLVNNNKLSNVMNNGSDYFQDDNTYEELKNSYLERFGAELSKNVSLHLDNLMGGQMNMRYNQETKKIVQDGWHLSRSQDILNKLQESIDSDYTMVDEINKFFERERLGLNNPSQEVRKQQTEESPQQVEQPLQLQVQNQTIAAVPTQQDEVQQPIQQLAVRPTPQLPVQQPIVNAVQPQLQTQQPLNQPVLLVQQVLQQSNPIDDALSIILRKLNLARLDDKQISPNDPIDQELLFAGQIIIRSTFDKGIYGLVDVVKETYNLLTTKGFTDSSINTILPFVPMWYLAESANYKYNNVADKFTTRVEMSNIDVFDIVNRLRFNEDDAESQKAAFERWKEDQKAQLKLAVLFDGDNDFATNISNTELKEGDKIGIINDDYGISVYTVQKVEDDGSLDIVNQDGVLVVLNGNMLTYDLIQKQYTDKFDNSIQKAVLDRLEKDLTESDKNVVGQPTAHDYFIKEGEIILLYPRVHTINGPEYDEELSQTDTRLRIYRTVLEMFRNKQYDRLSEISAQFDAKSFGRDRVVVNIKDIQNNEDVKRYVLFLQQFENPTEEDIVAAAKGVAYCVTQDPLGASLAVRELADKLVKDFFAGVAIDFNNYKIRFAGRTVYAKNITTPHVFNQFIIDLQKLKDTYDRAGYKISTTEHTLYTKITSSSGVQRVAGLTNIIAINQYGKALIIDTKTSKKTFLESIDSSKVGEQQFGPFYVVDKLFGKYQGYRSRYAQYCMLLSTHLMMMKQVLPYIEFINNPLFVLPVRVNYDYLWLENSIYDPEHNKQGGISLMRTAGWNGEPVSIPMRVIDNPDELFGKDLFEQPKEPENLQETINNVIDCIQRAESTIDTIDLDIVNAKDDETKAKLLSIKNKLLNLQTSLDDIKILLNTSRTEYAVASALSQMEDFEEQMGSVISEYEESLIENNTSTVILTDKRSIDVLNLDNLNKTFKHVADLWRDACVKQADPQTIRGLYTEMVRVYNKLKDTIETFKIEHDEYNKYIPKYSYDLINWMEQNVLKTPLPQVPQQVLSVSKFGGTGFTLFNTVEKNDHEKTAHDDPSLKLKHILENEDFGDESTTTTEVVGGMRINITKNGQKHRLVPIRITYKGHVFDVEIRIADNQIGDNMLVQINNALKTKQPGDRVLLYGIDKTTGFARYDSDTKHNILDIGILPKGYTYQDISMEGNQSVFGLAKRFGEGGSISVYAGYKNTEKTIYTFSNGRGQSGILYAIIIPNYSNKSINPERKAVAISQENLKPEDVDLIINLVQSKKETDTIKVNIDGVDSDTGVTVKEMLELFLPNGMTYLKFEAELRSDEQGLRQRMLLYHYEVKQNLLISRLSKNNSENNVFTKLAKWFSKRDVSTKISEVQFGSLVFSLDDFKNDGLSVLAWMFKNNMLYTQYAGGVDPRISYTGVSVEKAKVDDPSHVVIEDENEDDIPFEFDSMVYEDFGVDNSTQVNQTTQVTEEVIKEHLRKILGTSVPVEVVDNYARIINDFPPQYAGRCFRDLIYVSTHAAPGTEYHEAFHRIYRLLLTEKMRSRLDKYIRKMLKSIRGELDANSADRNYLNEFAANQCLKYFNGIENIKFSIWHPFEFIRQHYLVYKSIGSARMYFFYMAMKRGKFQDKQVLEENENMLRNVADNSLLIHGRQLESISSLRQYNQMLRSFVYYICLSQNISQDGRNLNKLDLSKEALDKVATVHKKRTFNLKEADLANRRNLNIIKKAIAEGNTPPKFRTVHPGDLMFKDGKPVEETFESSLIEIMLNSCKSELGKRAAKEMYDNWDVVRLDVIQHLNSMGINYDTSKDEDYNRYMLAGDFILNGDLDETDEDNWLSTLLKDSLEYSHTTRATIGIKCLFSMIKAYERTGNGLFLAVRNECGYYEYLDYKQVLSRIFADVHAIKTQSEMMEFFKNKDIEGDPMYRQIYQILYPYYKNRNKNINDLQIITQLFNIVACAQNKFKQVRADLNRKSGKYAVSVHDCGSEYESKEYRRDWGKLLIYGGAGIFKRLDNGAVVFKNDDSIQKLSTIYDTLESFTGFFTDANIESLLNDEAANKPLLKYNVKHLRMSNRSLDLSKQNDIDIFKRDLCVMLNYLGLLFSAEELDYLLQKEYGDQCFGDLLKLQKFFSAGGSKNIANLWTNPRNINLIVKTPDGRWVLNFYNDVRLPNKLNTIQHIKESSYQIPIEDLYNNNSFAIYLSNIKYKYVHLMEDMNVLVSQGMRYYIISENNTVTDVTDELSKGGKLADTLSRYCYNFYEDSYKMKNGDTNTEQIGSLLIKKAINVKPGHKLDLHVATLTQFKSDDVPNEGHDYFDISEVEDYLAKATILENGSIVFPTMSDKKTWHYIEGLRLPGITYKIDEKTTTVESFGENEQLNQLLEYAKCEFKAVEQTLKQLKNISPEQRVQNFHNGQWVKINRNSIEDAVNDLYKYKYIEKSEIENILQHLKDHKSYTTKNKRGKVQWSEDKNSGKISISVSHMVPNGAVFGSFNGIYDKNGKYISFNDVIDKNGEFISPEMNLEKAKEWFFDDNKLSSDDQRIAVIRRSVEKKVLKELKHIEKLGLIKKTQYGYENIGLNDNAIKALEQYYTSTGKTVAGFKPEHLAIMAYVKDITLKHIMSINEVERVFAGNPAFFKYKYGKVNRGGEEGTVITLIDRSTDEFKRLGGLISTGTNNNTLIKGLPDDGMYNCAIIEDQIVGSELAEFIRNVMSEAEWRAAALNLYPEEYDKFYKKLSVDEIKDIIKQEHPDVFKIISQKIKVETDAYSADPNTAEINVADGAAYISPEMTKWLLQMVGKYDDKVDRAFKILQNEEYTDEKTGLVKKRSIFDLNQAYSEVVTAVIGAQKYTAYGQRLSEQEDPNTHEKYSTIVPYYNKMALFPVFKCMATGKFSKLYKQMEELNVHMLMMESAVKFGELGKKEWTTEDDFQFNVFKQSFFYLRKQFNTDPHEQEDYNMGTQMVKVALTSLIEDHEYDVKGEKISGRDLLNQIMDIINKMCDVGESEINELLFDEYGSLDINKFSLFLHKNLTSRDANKSLLESISMVKNADGSWDMKHPLSATSSTSWIQSILASEINKKLIDVKTNGGQFYQRSVFEMEGATVISDEDAPESINGGNPLKMINEDGKAKWAMDCVLSIDFYEDVIKQLGLENKSFKEQRLALIDLKLIGPNATADLIGYRIPTQAQSSIHALRCVDVIPAVRHTIILPKEFTKITGSDRTISLFEPV